MSSLLNDQYESNKKGYHLNELFMDLDHSIFSELYKGTNIDFYKRNLQKMYVFRLIEQAYSGENAGLLEGPFVYPHYLSDIQGVIYSALRPCERVNVPGGRMRVVRVRTNAAAGERWFFC